MIEISVWQVFGLMAGSFFIGAAIGITAMVLWACRSMQSGRNDLEPE